MSASPLARAHDLIDRGELQQARAVLLRFLSKSPRDPDALMAACFVCAKLGDREPALHYAERSVAALPTDARAHVNRSRALLELGRASAAADTLIHALDSGLFPPDQHSYSLVAQALASAGAPDRALHWTERGLSDFPDHPPLLLNDGASALVCGNAARAVRSFRRAVQLNLSDPQALSNLLSALNYADLDVQHAAIERPAMYGRLIADLHGPAMFDWQVTPDPERPLRIGILSPDLRTHAVSYFIEPVLRAHDRAQWTVFAYSTASAEDARSGVLREIVGASRWRHVHGVRFAALADLIKADRIDVLIDLAGHTTANALPTLHLKPAPVQMTWIGYPHSTGVPSVDYRIVDSITDPPPSAPWPCVERPLHLDPCFLVWRPADGVAEPAPVPPSVANGYVTFGAFASLQKLSEATVRLWSATLRRVPNSRLLFKTAAFNSSGVRELTMKRLVAAGIAADCITLDPPGADARDMAAHYARMDISLDTFPYHGTTTTCECLWMGVPMVTLEGPPGVPASRVGCSIIRAACPPPREDAERMIARNDADYSEKAAAIAADPRRLLTWRSNGPEGLRANMAASPLRDEPARCRQLQRAVRGCWRAWCADRAG